MGISKEYTTEQGYAWLLGLKNKPDWYPIVWNKLSIPKHQVIQWLICRDRLGVKTKIQRFIDIDTTCYLCGQGEEDVNHLFCTYQFARGIFGRISDCLGYKFEGMELAEVRNNLLNMKGKNRQKAISCYAAIAATCYHLWRARNKLLHAKSSTVEEELVHCILYQLNAYWGRVRSREDS